MVRLKALLVNDIFPFTEYFNSTMVRLKEDTDSVRLLHSVFQFHYGTIKRESMINAHNNAIYFNSTMVRLKGLVQRRSLLAVCNFNSTMVRLKVASQIKLNESEAFQFHYGTIKRTSEYERGMSNSISIPLWYD